MLSARIQAAKLLTLSPNKPYGLRVYALGRKVLCVRTNLVPLAYTWVPPAYTWVPRAYTWVPRAYT